MGETCNNILLIVPDMTTGHRLAIKSVDNQILHVYMCLCLLTS